MVNTREGGEHPYNRRIDVLLLCTANQCRSPMAEVLLRRHLERAEVDATVSSAGLWEGGAPATGHAVATMADRGLDLDQHASRPVDEALLRSADLVIGMARVHVREAEALVPGALRKTFTLKELVKVATTAGERGADEALNVWLGRLADDRLTGLLVGVTHDDELDVADPAGMGRADYEATADLLDRLLGELVDLAFPVHTRPEAQRA